MKTWGRHVCCTSVMWAHMYNLPPARSNHIPLRWCSRQGCGRPVSCLQDRHPRGERWTHANGTRTTPRHDEPMTQHMG